MAGAEGRPPFSWRADAAVPPFDDTAPVAVMDGECALCTGGARTIARFDRSGAIRIVPARSALGSALLRHYGLSPDDPESWLYIEDGRAAGSLDGIVAVGRRIGGVFGLARVLLLLPHPVRDWLYRRIARNRYRLFGRADMCAVPDPALRRRLLS